VDGGSMGGRAKRPYSSPLRQEAAEATRMRILGAAREVLLEAGYPATTMAVIARRAGVAVQTLYAAFPGGKATLARAVYDVTLAGDGRPIPQSDRPEVHAITAEPDPVRKLARFAAMAAGIAVRVGPVHRVLRSAAATDAAAGELVARAEHQRLVGSRGPVEHLAGCGLLRSGLSVEEAAARVYVLTGPEVFERLTTTCGWSVPAYRDWLTELLVAALLEPAQNSRRSVDSVPRSAS